MSALGKCSLISWFATLLNSYMFLRAHVEIACIICAICRDSAIYALPRLSGLGLVLFEKGSSVSTRWAFAVPAKRISRPASSWYVGVMCVGPLCIRERPYSGLSVFWFASNLFVSYSIWLTHFSKSIVLYAILSCKTSGVTPLIFHASFSIELATSTIGLTAEIKSSFVTPRNGHVFVGPDAIISSSSCSNSFLYPSGFFNFSISCLDACIITFSIFIPHY